MEDVILRMPSKDISLLSQFAQRMGWEISQKENVMDAFIRQCAQTSHNISDDAIMDEVKAVRYQA